MDDLKAISALKVGILLTAVFFVLELLGGYISGSLSLLSDAGHMFRDVLALVLSLFAIRLALKLPTDQRTFGYHRVEVLAALLNGLMLLVISGWIIYEAVRRIGDPVEIETRVMFVVASIGLVINAIVTWKLHGSHDLNVRSAFLHVLSDLLSSVAVITASIIIYFTGWSMVDPILSIIIAIFIIVTSIKLIWDSLYIILEFTPKNVDIDELISTVESIDGVEGVHNVHVWTLCSNINLMDAHIFTNEVDMVRIETIKTTIKEKLKKYDIAYTTIEFECKECKTNGRVCSIDHC